MPGIRGEKLLTDRRIRGWLKNPQPADLHDGGGLYLRSREGGAFWALRQVNPLTGRRTWAALAPGVPYPYTTLEAARAAALAARALPAANTDLVRHRRAEREARRTEEEALMLIQLRRLSMRQLFKRWRETDLQPRVGTDGRRTGRKDGGQYVQGQFERHVFPRLGDVAIDAVTRADLLGVLDTLKSAGRLRTANVVLTDLRQMLNFAVERELISANPLQAVSKARVGGKETERERVLSEGEISALARALPFSGMSARGCAAVWLILSTGVRVGEAMRAEWGHVDLDGRRWTIPAEHAKNQREHVVHLSAFALEQLQALLAARPVDSKGRPVAWVFPSADLEGPVCVKSLGKQLADRQRTPDRRMQHRSKATGSLALPGGRWTCHDLRRTAATLMASLGISSDVIDECLNHMIESRVTRTYVRDRRLSEQARAFEALSAKLASLVHGVEPENNVVPLREAA